MKEVIKSLRDNYLSKSSKRGIVNIFPYISKEFFGLENWNYKKSNLNVNVIENSMVIESKKNKVSYISFLEKNTNFNISPKHSKRIMLNDDILCRITGKPSKNLKATVYILEYDANGRKLKTNRVYINNESVINIHPETNSIRLAIRLVGKGEIAIDNVKLIRNFNIPSQSISKKILKGKKVRDIKMACILDEFSMESFSNNITLITFTPENWKSILSQNKPDFLFVESAWRGNFGSWEYQIGKYNNNNNNRLLKELISWCNKNQIPTVFWNKEDPVHFEKFIGAASLFDLIFTTDGNMIHKYKELVNHNKVYSMQFAADPRKHNPTMVNKIKRNKISFAGSYYANRHLDRRKDMDEMLEVANKFGLEIFDRNYERNKSGNSHFMFPDKFKNSIVGTLEYRHINKAYKDYRLILNVNSVKESPTMFSRRVFEGLACGTPIISSYSSGIKKTFNNIVVIDKDRKALEGRISELMTNDESYRDLAMLGIRKVYRQHTYLHRLKTILNLLKINYEEETNDITVIFKITSNIELNKALEIVKSQTYENIKVVLLISLFEGYESILNNYNKGNVRTYIQNYAYKYKNISELITTKYVTVMNTENSYGQYYLEDLMHASIYTEADIIGKKSLLDDDDYSYSKYEYEFVESVIPETAIYRTEKISNFEIQVLLNDPENLITSLFKEYGARIYSNDKFNIKINTLRK